MTVAADTLDDVKRVRGQVEGEKLRVLMVSLEDITIRALADHLGVEQRTVSRWRAGKMDRLTWLGLLHALDLPADWEPGDPVPARSVALAKAEDDVDLDS